MSRNLRSSWWPPRLPVAGGLGQARFIADEIRRLRSLDSAASFADFAVLARTRRELGVVRAVLEEQQIPFDWRADDNLRISLFRVREVHAWVPAGRWNPELSGRPAGTPLADQLAALWTPAVTFGHSAPRRFAL